MYIWMITPGAFSATIPVLTSMRSWKLIRDAHHNKAKRWNFT